MTRNAFLLSLPVLSFLTRDKIINVRNEYEILKTFFEKNTINDQYLRVFWLENIYGYRKYNYDSIDPRVSDYVLPDEIMNGHIVITERQFKRDCEKTIATYYAPIA